MTLRKLGRVTAYLLFLLVVCLVSSEIFLRFLLPASQGYFIWPPNLHVVFKPTPETTPGVSGDGDFRSNSLGLRSDEPPPDRQQTIYVFGGSTAIDVYLDQKRSWVYQVQTKLNATSGESKTWVGNLARSSLSTVSNLLIFKYLMPHLPKPDLFVNLVGVNDLQLALKSSYLKDMTMDRHMSFTFSEMPSQNFWSGLAVSRFYQRIKDWRIKANMGVTQTYGGDGFTAWRKCRAEAPPDKLVDELPDLSAALDQYRRNLHELVKQGNAYGATTIFLTQPTVWSDHIGPAELSQLLAGGIGPNNVWCVDHRYYSPRALAEGMAMFNHVLLDVCRDLELFCVDLASEVPKRARYYFDDMHYSDAGADLVSDVVSRKIIEFQAQNGGSLHMASHQTLASPGKIGSVSVGSGQ